MDEFSRYRSPMSWYTLQNRYWLFYLFVFPEYIHGDQGMCFMVSKAKCSWQPEELLRVDLLRIIRRVTRNARELSKLFGILSDFYLTAVLCPRTSGSLPENRFSAREQRFFAREPVGRRAARCCAFYSFVNPCSCEWAPYEWTPFRFPWREMSGSSSNVAT